MKKLSPYYIIVALFMLTITSCEDNYITEGEPEVTISDPLEVESTLVSGRVLDINDVAVPDAEVIVSHDGEITSVYSDDEGNYAFSLPKDDTRILMQVHSDNFVKSGVDALTLDTERKERDIKLLKSEELDYDGNVSFLTQSTNAILSGQVLLSDGNPAADIKIILLDVSTFLFTSYDITDEGGFYSIASEPFDNYILFAVSDCEGAEVIAENISLNNQDIDFGVFQGTFSIIDQFTVSGTVTNCNTGEPLLSGTVAITFDGNSEYYSTGIIDGTYTLFVDNCLDVTCYNVKVTTPLFLEEIELECEPITGSEVVADYELCGEELVNISNAEIRLLIGTDSLIYETATAEFDATTDQWVLGAVKENINDRIAIHFKGDPIGTVEFIFLQIEDTQLGLFQNYNASGVPLNLEFTEFGDDIRGTISGQLITEAGQLTSISGTIAIEL